MKERLTRWLENSAVADPLERRQAVMVQVILLGMIISSVFSLPLALFTSAEPFMQLVNGVGLLMILVPAAGGLALLRSGRFRSGVMLNSVGLVLALVVFGVLFGPLRQPSIIAAMLMPLALAGLLVGRRELVVIGVLSLVSLTVVIWFELQPGSMVGFVPPLGNMLVVTAGGLTLLMVVFGLFFDQFRSSFTRALREALAREHELEALRSNLEATVVARTAELQATVDQLQASQATVRELGAPVLPVLPGVLVAPLIGTVDTARASDLAAAVLAAIDRTHARHLILDITGVPVVDTHVTLALLRTAEAARLLGAEALLVGVSAEVAQTIVTLGVDLRAIRIYPNLQEAVTHLLGASAMHTTHTTNYAYFTS
jgi:rsbT co-antagonist protein RsbR